MFGGKRSHKVQVNVGEVSGWNRDGRKKSMNMCLEFSPLATETSKGLETHVLGQTRPNETGGEKSLISMDTWMRRTVEKIKKSPAKLHRSKRAEISRGDVTEQGGGTKRNGD